MLELEPCVPPRWASGGHQQTLLGHFWPSPRLKDKGRRIEIPLPDGDRLVGFHLQGSSNILVYLFHGLAGSIDSTYIHRTALLVQRLGHSVFMVNHRTCGEGAGLAERPYHSGRGEDLSAAIALGRTLFPQMRHLAIGFSLSGNALLLLLTGRRGETQPDLAISVNAPIDLQLCSRALSHGFNRIYDMKFYLQCRRDVLYARRPGAKSFHIPHFSTLREFDSLYTAPAGGFKDRDDYYTRCSTAQWLSLIRIPTVMFTAKDDPFVICESYEQAKLSSSIHLHIEESGGHMGYISRSPTPLGNPRWQDYALGEAITALVRQ